MNMNNIGLKLADGEFYPVLQDGAAARKRLVVTTVQDGQPSVQIDLYRGVGPTVTDAAYIGSLVVEGIPSMAKGEPDIRMDLGLAEDGTLTAFAQEASTGASQSLKVSLEALSEEEKYEIPDFEFTKSEAEPSAFSDEDFEGTDSLPPEADSAQLLADVRSEAEAEEARERPQRKTRSILLAALGILVILLILGFLAYKFLLYPTPGAGTAPAGTSPAVPASAQAAPAVAAQPAPEAAPAAAPAPKPVAEAPKPALPEKKAPSFKQPGVSYKIRWGDTLWDLSYAYYRDPWVFMRIAKANKIKNPDLIISGDKIWIPAK
jgi:hypothetical protein